MKKLLCRLFDHKIRWVIAYQEIRCIRCGQKMGFTIADWLRWEKDEYMLGNKTEILKSI
jgi:hypothetical protein